MIHPSPAPASCRGLCWLLLPGLIFYGCLPAPARERPGARESHLLSLQIQARQAYEQGLLHRAKNCYQRALVIAEGMDDADQIGNMAYNLAVCRIELGEYEETEPLLWEAEKNLTRIKANLNDVLLVQAKLARLKKDPGRAEALAERVLKDTGRRGSFALAAMVIEADTACDQGHVPQARERLDAAVKMAGPYPSAIAGSDLARIRGRIALLSGNPKAAAEEFSTEAQLAYDARLYRQLARAWARAGYAWRDAGDLTHAAECLYRAARTLWAQGFDGEAQAVLDSAQTCARESQAAKILQDIQYLRDRMKEDASAASQPFR